MGWTEQMALTACVGLDNRWGQKAYILWNDNDATWLQQDFPAGLPATTPREAYMNFCYSSLAKGYVAYNATAQQALIPSVITVASALDAVPLEAPPASANLTCLADLVRLFDGYEPVDAATYAFDTYGNQTTSLAKVNPGWRGMSGKGNLHPQLTGAPDFKLFDYIVKARLFAMFLVDACIPLTKEHALMTRMAAANVWPRPIVVYGYDDTWALFGGDFFEAETLCVAKHNMGQVAANLLP